MVLGDLRGEASVPVQERSVTLDKRVARAARELDRAQANDAVTIMISRLAYENGKYESIHSHILRQ